MRFGFRKSRLPTWDRGFSYSTAVPTFKIGPGIADTYFRPQFCLTLVGMSYTKAALAALMTVLTLAAGSKKGDKTSPPPPVRVFDREDLESAPLPQVLIPSHDQKQNLKTASMQTDPSRLEAALAIAPEAVTNARPRDMKLLVLSPNADLPSYQSLKFSLETLGVPFQSVFTASAPLPPLTDGTKGLFQGIMLATGNLAVCDPTCRSTLAAADWDRLDSYTRDFGVRTVSYYTFPEPRYGMTFISAFSTDATPASINFTASAAPIFSYLNRANPLRVSYAYVYLAAILQGNGEVTTPILTVNSQTAGVVHKKADGREYLALTVDNSPFLLHSTALNYGLVNWVTNGIFIGARKVYMTPQVDDHFLPNDLFVAGMAACMPAAFIVDPTFDPAESCPTLRIEGNDLKTVADWQAEWNKKPQFAQFRVTHAFNGFGAISDAGVLLKDSLVDETRKQAAKFYWINHTWDHENLDCYAPVPNSGVCAGATYAQSIQEISLNRSMAATLGLPLDTTSMVTPNISGLDNPEFMRAAADQGIRYLVSDSSRPGYLPAIPNTGLRSTTNPSILLIPRRATNVFYNTGSGQTAVQGSLPDEYNYFFGPAGIFQTGGAAFFNTTQSYNDIVQRESDNLLAYMLRYEIYPQMYHQANLWRFKNKQTLLTDVIDAAFDKFSKISTLPVLSLPQTEIGRELEERMGLLNAGVQGTLTPGVEIRITASARTTVPLTGVCAAGCESYGGQSLSKAGVEAGAVTIIPFSGGLPDSGPPMLGPATGSKAGDFNGTAIAAGKTIWFSSIVKPDFGGDRTGIVEVRNAVIRFTANNTNYAIPVPDAVIRLDAAAVTAQTEFNGNRWETVVPAGYKDDIFMAGVPFVVPGGGLPGGIKNVIWTADLYSSKSGASFKWKWAAAVYTQFSAPAAIGVKPIDGDKLNPYQNKDSVATPELFKSFVVKGALGDGKSDYTGKWSGDTKADF